MNKMEYMTPETEIYTFLSSDIVRTDGSPSVQATEMAGDDDAG